jgi:hypothetical protein
MKIHLPYHESDHVLNLAYNVLTGGARLEDIERFRHDVAYLNAVGAGLIPDPTTAGDFCRRFTADDAVASSQVAEVVAIWGVADPREHKGWKPCVCGRGVPRAPARRCAL